MADQSSTADLLSAPPGGGAVRPLGETFQPDLHTGTGNLSVPLELPPGRGSLAPHLSLTYSSGNGNGPLGLGWQLSVPGIRRKTDKRIPTYDGRDVFILSGAEDLIPVRGGSNGVQRYRPRTESLFARIEHHTAGTDHWEVWTKDGLHNFYGSSRLADDDGTILGSRGRIYSWQLTRTEDTYGNSIAYSYQADPNDPAGPQRYLKQIQYVDSGDASAPSYLIQVRFTLQPRFDRPTDRRPGFALTTGARYSTIETWINATDEQLVRRATLKYTDGATGTAGAKNGVSLLESVTVTGIHGKATEALPPIEFSYSGWDPSSRTYRPVGGPVPTTSLADRDLDLVDMLGTGLPDLLQLSGSVARFWRNLGQATFDHPKPLGRAPSGLSLSNSGVQLLDADGDGRPDLVVTNGGRAGYFPVGRDGEFDAAGYTAYGLAPSLSPSDPNTRLVDLDGDGVADILHIGTQVVAFLNDRHGGWSENRVLSSPLTAVSLSDPRMRLADMTGDGLTDVVLVGNGYIQYWPNAGYGVFEQPVRMSSPPRFDDAGTYGATGFDPARLLIGDVDGDGVADVVYVGSRGTTVWLNQAGHGFAPAVFIPGTPRPDSTAAIRLTDLLGCGTSGILWTFDGRPRGDSAFKFLDLTGGSKPYLLVGVDNHMGGRTTISYAPSTTYALADAAAGAPWKTTLPFPVQVVSTVTTTEEFSRATTTTQFDYHHGYWDGADREFRGFGRVHQRDTTRFDVGSGVPEEYFSPPTETRTWFHSGPVGSEFGDWVELDLSGEYCRDDPNLLGGGDRSAIPQDLPRRALRDVIRCMRGSVMRTELYGLDGSELQDRPYTVTEHSYDLLPIIDPDAGADPDTVDDVWRSAPVVTKHASGTRATQWARGTDPMTRVSVNLAFDRYGNTVESMSVAAPRNTNLRTRGPAGQPLLATITTTEYATRDDPTHYICDRASSTRREEIFNDGALSLDDLVQAVRVDTLPRRTRAFSRTSYDGEPFIGPPPGQLGDHGAPTSTASLVQTRGGLGTSHDPAAPPPYLAGEDTLLTEGLRADYFRDDSLTVPAFTRPDRCIAFHWKQRGPDPYMCQPTFSVRWTGRLHADFSETYALTPVGVGGVRLWVDGNQILDAWAALDGTSGTVALTTGASHDLVVEYRATGWDAAIDLQWSSASQPAATIDSSHLTPPANQRPQPWDDSYPAAFRDAVPPCAGYVYQAGQDGMYDPGYYAVTRTEYDNLGLPRVHRDELGRDTTIAYDAYHVLPTCITDPANLTRTAEYDYRALKPNLIVDINGNHIHIGYTPLGLVSWTAALGHPDVDEGDTLAQPGTRYFYDLTAYDDSTEGNPQPLAVHTIRRVDYRWTTFHQVNAERAAAHLPPATDDQVFPPDEDKQSPERFIQTRSYNDGAGRVLQTRTQSDTFVIDDLGLPLDVGGNPSELVAHEDHEVGDPPVVVSGWQRYDNKGRVVQAWEPFFAKGWTYGDPTDQLDSLASSRTQYDPRGSQVRVIHPDRSEDRIIYGEPLDPTDPERYSPTAWVTYHYDANDNAGRTHAEASAAWSDHWNTPSITVLDAHGRPTTSMVGLGGRQLRTMVEYDVDGRPMLVRDPLDRVVSSSVYDMTGRAWRSTLLDLGTTRTVYDAQGNVVEQRDAKGAVILTRHDRLGRPIAKWARDNGLTPPTLREAYVFGDAADVPDPAAANLCGKIYWTYDEAGTVETSLYDLAGRLRTSTRRVLSTSSMLSSAPDAFTTDWQADPTTADGRVALERIAASMLDATPYRLDQTWDALGRQTSVTSPADDVGQRHTRRASYTCSGAIAAITLDNEPYLDRIAYNARGQRIAVWFGNGVLTRHAHDPVRFRLARQWSARASEGTSGRWVSTGPPLQDISYSYDLTGNVLAKRDRTPGSGVNDGGTPDALDRTFTYDPLYRLTSANGREHKESLPEVWSSAPRGDDMTATQRYCEHYKYDDADNLSEIAHHANSSGYTRTMRVLDGSNRLDKMSANDYTWDPCGNMTTETTSRTFTWDARNRMNSFSVGNNGSMASQMVQYRYDTAGARVLKLLRTHDNAQQLTIYAGGMLERLIVMDTVGQAETYDQIRLGDELRVVKRIRLSPGDGKPPILYHLTDYLSSSVVVIDARGGMVNREEYLPYGETSFGSFHRKRFRFTGKERDEESGLTYHGARYYACWLGRWISCDPAGMADGTNSFAYAGCRPTRFVDTTGRSGSDTAPPTICHNPPISYTAEGVPVIEIHPPDSNVAHPHDGAAVQGGQSTIWPDVGQVGAVVTAASRALGSLLSTSGTSLLYAGSSVKDKYSAMKGAELLTTEAAGYEMLDQTKLGRAAKKINDAALEVTQNKGLIRELLWKPVSGIYGFQAGLKGNRLLRLIQTNLPLPAPPHEFGAILRNIEVPAYKLGKALRASGVPALLGGALAVLGGGLSAIGLAHNVQTGDVAEGVGNALGLGAAITTGALSSVLLVASIAYLVGTLANRILQPVIDRYLEPGSGRLGHWYYEHFLK